MPEGVATAALRDPCRGNRPLDPLLQHAFGLVVAAHHAWLTVKAAIILLNVFLPLEVYVNGK